MYPCIVNVTVHTTAEKAEEPSCTETTLDNSCDALSVSTSLYIIHALFSF